LPLPDFSEEACRVVEKADERGVIIRVMGATVIKRHCLRFQHLSIATKRILTDLDFVTYGRFGSLIKPIFIELGYTPDDRFNAYFGRGRQQYVDSENNRMADVFLDRLEMNHTVDFKDRLELDSPTISLADFLLEKMQIVRLNEKDVIDTALLLREHKVGNVNDETIDAGYIAKTLARDWGFYHTVRSNLTKVRKYTLSNLSEEDDKDINSKIDQLLASIENEPKNSKWKFRARVGTRKKWYNEVADVVR
jgi:hypothetical protein